MGYYIDFPDGQMQGKADRVVKEFDGMEIPQPTSFDKVPDNMGLICVVENPFFDAAGFCYDEREFKAFTSTDDPRRKRWILINRKTAEEQTGFQKRG